MTPRQEFEQAYGKVWDTGELTEEFSVESFLAPYVFVKRKQDDVRGTLKFNHRPRFYYSFSEVT